MTTDGSEEITNISREGNGEMERKEKTKEQRLKKKREQNKDKQSS